VPDFIGGYWADVGGIPALTVWQNQGFTGTLTNRAQHKQIESQTLTPGSTMLCTTGMVVDDKP
jgi:hypothetical protein